MGAGDTTLQCPPSSPPVAAARLRLRYAARLTQSTNRLLLLPSSGTLIFPFPTDCSQELLNGIRTSGEAEIFPYGKLGTPVEVYCDMETDGGGWTVNGSLGTLDVAVSVLAVVPG